ncbi:MAG: GntR family transcriptional regulator [Candidatus Sumerlaeaceae bacterium]|nr:GntR family transcriptional regulator [Candidatus Sumerlaeaceae bacterium]
MQIRISPNDGVPIYQQIVNQVKYLVASGRVLPGEELPTIRALAERLLVNPNTVARAYRELEIAGVVISRQGSGTIVAEDSPRLGTRERTRILSARADDLLSEARHLGVEIEELIKLLRQRDDAMSRGRRED